MADNAQNASQLQVLLTRKSEMDRLLTEGERVVSDKVYIASLIQMQQTFCNLAKKVYNASDLDFSLNGNRVKCRFMEPSEAFLLGQFATLINYTSLKFEHIFSADSIFTADELLQCCAIEDISENPTSYGQTTAELKEILKKVRNAFSHNREYLKSQGFYSGSNFTSAGNLLIDTKISGGTSVVIKTDIDRLYKFFCQIDKQKEQMKEDVVEEAGVLSKKSGETAVRAQFGDKIIVISASADESCKYYFDPSCAPMQEIRRKMIEKGASLIDEQMLDDNIRRRALELYRTYAYNVPDIFDYRNRGALVQNIATHFMLNGYPTTMLNATLNLHEFTRCWDFNRSVEDNMAVYFNTAINEFQMVERMAFVRNDLYPACVMNVAKFLFANHEKELKEYIEEQRLEQSEIYASIPYKQDDLCNRLRNSVHHGRFLFEYPDKSVFKQGDIKVSLFDGKGTHHNFVMSMSIKDLASLTESFGLYLCNANAQTCQSESEGEGGCVL